jgi:hypothetical protein
MQRRRWSLRAESGSPSERPCRVRVSPWGRLTPLALAGAILAGCGSWFGSPEPSGLGSNGVRDTCSWATVHDDCLPTEFCDAPDCMGLGGCVKRPEPLESGEGNWTCGCDGVTYWNVTFARAQGVTAPTLGQCGGPSSGGGVTPRNPLACTSSAGCPRGSICLPTACTGTQGHCWAWPNDYVCAPGAQLGYKLCDGTGGCLTECQAITSQTPYSMSTINCK